MSDINTYADEAAITGLTPINGDLVLNRANNSLYLCTDSSASGIARWKKFTNDSALNAFTNSWSASFDNANNDHIVISGLGTAGVSIGCISVWVNTPVQIQTNVPNSSGRGYFVGWGSTGSFNGFSHGYMNTSDKMLTYYAGGNRSYWSPGVGVKLDAGWHNIVVNHNGTGYEFYVDGVNASSHALGGTVTVNPVAKTSGTGLDNFMIGKTGGGFGTTGLFDEVALWSDGLTPSQISDIYNNGVPGDLEDLTPTGWWRMGDSDSATDGGLVSGIQDISGNGYHATTVANSQPTFSTVVPS